MREHFAAIPTHGDVKIRLPLSDANAQALEEMRQALGRRLDTTLTIGDALSALLFDYVVELKTSQILDRSEEHTSELQSLMRISYAVFCLKKNKKMYE